MGRITRAIFVHEFIIIMSPLLLYFQLLQNTPYYCFDLAFQLLHNKPYYCFDLAKYIVVQPQ